jgi:hypothetical protein
MYDAPFGTKRTLPEIGGEGPKRIIYVLTTKDKGSFIRLVDDGT